jgi:hypothetical protein
LSRALAAAGIAGGLLLALFALVALSRDESQPAHKQSVDARSGSYRGVELGMTRREAVQALGPAPRWTPDDSIAPLEDDWVDIGAPNQIPSSGNPDVLRYPHVAVQLDNGVVTSIVIAERGAETHAGVGIGDGMKAVRRAYPDMNAVTQRRAMQERRFPIARRK